MARPPAVRSGPTINDIARHLGVHKSTVSRAMDPERRHLVAEPLLGRVEAAARELGWRPNRAAAALSTGRSRTVGVLLPDITNPVFPPMLRGIEDVLDVHGYFALLANTGQGRDRPGGVPAAQAAAERMLAQPVEGFIIATAQRDDAWLDALQAEGARIVLVNRTRDDLAGPASQRPPLPAVVSDDRLGMRLAVDHLVALGHRHIAHLAGPALLSTGHARRQGFEQALAAHGLSAAAIVECASYGIEAGDAALQSMLDGSGSGSGGEGAGAGAGRAGGRPTFTGLVAANDLLALGALQALQRAGCSVPQAVSVVGHNDMPLLAQMSPPVTSVRIQLYEMGRLAAQRLLDEIAGVPGAPLTRVLAPTLAVRGSTGPVRDDR